MRPIAAAFALLFAFAAPLSAQDRANTILVMDGSGSMWGQIDGINKIVIAREVVEQILGDFPADQNLGLTVYGHRERGNCADIETVVAPGAGTTPAIIDAVNAINPRGKTPMTDAVIMAAEALRYTEEAATVILVSDGIETCNPDPCAAARELEQAGINFTAHVVGFDVTEEDALAQMQCLAEETGGQFITASNADELSAALTTVAAAAPEPVIETYPVTFIATRGQGGPVATFDMLWDIEGPDGLLIDGSYSIADNALVFQDGTAVLDLPPASYTATAYGAAEEISGSAAFTVTDAPLTVTVILPAPLPDATLTASDEAPLGAMFAVEWTGPDGEGDYIGIADPEDARAYINYALTSEGSPLMIEMPPAQGVYELRYFQRGTAQPLAVANISAGPVEVGLDAQPEATAGETITVAWVGPDYDLDFISVAMPGSTSYINYAYTRDGSPAMLAMPVDPGTYELRYVLRQDNTTIATRPITVIAVQGSLTAPDTAIAGETIQVGWTGPDYDLDYIAVGLPGEPAYVNYSYPRDGTPLDLLMPTEPGNYEIRYVLRQDSEVLVTRPITVTDVTASLIAPDTATAGETILVGWTGPDYDQDFISVGLPGETAYANYSYTREGNPLELVMPTEPGDYEIRYTLRQDSDVIATRPIAITDVAAQIIAPDTAPAGATIQVGWTGPDYDQDFIAIGLTGERGYENYTYTREGTPLPLVMPPQPGDYEIRYTLRQDSEVIASHPINVQPVNATLTAPASADVGQTITVSWTGPDYDQDFIAVGLVGERGYENYTYTREGASLELVMPSEPGAYEIRYTMRQDSTVLHSIPITVEEVKASLVAAPTVALSAGEIIVGWDGPDYPQDFIAISEVGDRGYETYTYTREGNPVTVRLPDTAGEYEIRYFMRQDSRVLGFTPLTITAE